MGVGRSCPRLKRHSCARISQRAGGTAIVTGDESGDNAVAAPRAHHISDVLRLPAAARMPTRAVFLDRDGILNRNVFYADTYAWESPRSASEVELTGGLAPALRLLLAAGYLLIVVSNQPNAAKGKCSRQALDAVHAKVISLLAAEGVTLHDHYLCLHHPEHTGTCACRKPSPFFLLEAARKHGLDLERSWMIGDRASDVACGRAAGTFTIWVNTGEGASGPAPECAADLAVHTVPDAVQGVLELSSGIKPVRQASLL